MEIGGRPKADRWFDSDPRLQNFSDVAYRDRKTGIDTGVGRLNPYPSVRVSEGSDKERVPA